MVLREVVEFGNQTRALTQARHNCPGPCKTFGYFILIAAQ